MQGIMKKLGIYLWVVLALAACNDDDNVVDLVPAATGTVTDSQGNEYGWVRIGGLDWTTTNARNGSLVWDVEYYHPDYGYYETVEFDADEEEYFATYGNLLSYDEAIASAPEGWRRPSDDDWKQLERALGMGDEVDEVGWRGDIADDLLRVDGNPGLGLLLGGSVLFSGETYGVGCLLKYDGEAAYYWTSTMDESATEYPMAYFRKLVSGQKGVERQRGDITYKYMSVRWVRDAQ